jgi:hypothetical protein
MSRLFAHSSAKIEGAVSALTARNSMIGTSPNIEALLGGRPRLRPLLPEEDVLGDPDDEEDEIDDLLPGDLWF